MGTQAQNRDGQSTRSTTIFATSKLAEHAVLFKENTINTHDILVTCVLYHLAPDSKAEEWPHNNRTRNTRVCMILARTSNWGYPRTVMVSLHQG